MGDTKEARMRGGRGFGHTMYDTVDKVELRVHRECVGNAAVAALRIANIDEWPVEHRSQEEIDELVRGQGYRETMELGERLNAYLSAKRDKLRPETKVHLQRMLGSWDEVI